MPQPPDDIGSTLDAMIADMAGAPEIVQASKYWLELNKQHMQALRSPGGFASFKRTLARNYFMWTRVLPTDPQIRFLVRHLPAAATLRALAGTFVPLKHRHIPLLEGLALNFLTRLIWQFAARDAAAQIAVLSEPQFGNPPTIRMGARLVSQDLANSVLEYGSIRDVADVATICELGGGYGRTAYVIATLVPQAKYVMIDIPPALAVAQTYLQQVFPEKQVFRYRAFTDFSTVEEEFARADLAFLLPHQLSKLPAGTCDLFLNISSLHEMRRDQIDYYVGEIFRVVRPLGHFYLKAWKVSTLPFENIVIREDEYPLDDWRIVYRRTPKVQSHFFETLLQKPPVTASAQLYDPSERARRANVTSN